MHLAMIIDEQRLAQEYMMLNRLAVGLIGDGIQVTRIVPAEVASEYIQPNIGGDIALLKGIAKAVIEKEAANTDFVNHYTNGYEDYKQDILNNTWDEIISASGVKKEQIEKVADI